VTIVGKKDAAWCMELPCGRCVGCKRDRAREWSIRISHEASLYDVNWFVTLDYSDMFLPLSRSLEYRHFQLFMKRLRKKRGGANGRDPVRFFVAGEYGERFKRPHWHAILFNVQFPDREKYRNGTWRSGMLEELWGQGNCVMGAVTARSAAYVAGYTQSKLYGRKNAEHYEDVVNPLTGEVFRRRPEFCESSQGIGRGWFDKYKGDLFPHDFAVQDGKKFRVPRYYMERFAQEADSQEDAELLLRMKEARYERAMEQPACESSPERRAVKKELAERKVAFYQTRNH